MEIFNFCTRVELGKGISLASLLFNAISEPLMHEQREHSLPNLVLDASHQQLPTTRVPENIIAGESQLKIR